MSKIEQLVRDVVKYRELAITLSSERDPDATKEHVDAGDRIVRHWAMEGHLRDILSALLEDSAPEVRYAAAADLLGAGESDLAVPALEQLANTPPVSADAFLLLAKWRNKQGQ